MWFGDHASDVLDQQDKSVHIQDTVSQPLEVPMKEVNRRRARQTIRLQLGDCVKRLAELPEASVDEIVCDPPYG